MCDRQKSRTFLAHSQLSHVRIDKNFHSPRINSNSSVDENDSNSMGGGMSMKMSFRFYDTTWNVVKRKKYLNKNNTDCVIHRLLS